MRLVCAGGGTLGSVTPLLAVVDELRQRGGTVDVFWFGTHEGPERQLVESCHIPFRSISAGKLRRYWSWRNIVDVVLVAVGFVQSWWWFKHHRVDAVLGAGSFVTVPVGYAAWCWGISVLIHQQDVRVSLANRLLAPVATRITVVFTESQRDFSIHKTRVTGNPVRHAFTTLTPSVARQGLGIPSEGKVLVVVGGGTGAQFLNDLVAQSIRELSQFALVIHLTGAGKNVPVPSSDNYRVMQFTTDSPRVLAAADVVVTRAGMGVLTELAALKKASVVVPLPGTHQEENAGLLARANAAVVCHQSALTSHAFIATVRQLLESPEQRQQLGASLAQLFPAQAARLVADELHDLVKRK